MTATVGAAGAERRRRGRPRRSRAPGPRPRSRSSPAIASAIRPLVARPTAVGRRVPTIATDLRTVERGRRSARRTAPAAAARCGAASTGSRASASVTARTPARSSEASCRPGSARRVRDGPRDRRRERRRAVVEPGGRGHEPGRATRRAGLAQDAARVAEGRDQPRERHGPDALDGVEHDPRVALAIVGVARRRRAAGRSPQHRRGVPSGAPPTALRLGRRHAAPAPRPRRASAGRPQRHPVDRRPEAGGLVEVVGRRRPPSPRGPRSSARRGAAARSRGRTAPRAPRGRSPAPRRPSSRRQIARSARPADAPVRRLAGAAALPPPGGRDALGDLRGRLGRDGPDRAPPAGPDRRPPTGRSGRAADPRPGAGTAPGRRAGRCTRGRRCPSWPHGHGFIAATNVNRAGNTSARPTLTTATLPSSSGWRSASSTSRPNSGSSSHTSVPWSASVTSPGDRRGPPPIMPA